MDKGTYVKSGEEMNTSTSDRVGSLVSLLVDSVNEFLGVWLSALALLVLHEDLQGPW
jgi:hypothetical protein